MARGNRPEPPRQPPNLLVPWTEAHQDVRIRIEMGRSLLERAASTDSNALRADGARWDDYNYQLLRRIFDTQEIAEDEYGHQNFGSTAMAARLEDDRHRLVARAIEQKVNKLVSIKDQLAMLANATPLMKLKTSPGRAVEVDNAKVFLVHGRDETALAQAALYLERLDLLAVVLREQANKGQTLIEKVESNSDVGCAVILVTPDDVGRAQSEPEGDQVLRARENVIWEFGYFVGRLGRSRVIALLRPGVKLPSDLHGFAYHEMDDGGAWKQKLAKELLAAGVTFDLAKAL